MNNLASINPFTSELTLTVSIGNNGAVEVSDRSRTMISGNTEYCLNAIRNFMSTFDAGSKRVHFDIYDNTKGTPEGANTKKELRDKLMLMKSSWRAQVEVVAHMNSYRA